MIKILLAEEHKIVREGIKSLLKDEVNMSIAAEARTGKEAIEKISSEEINLAILDIHMSVLNSIETVRHIKENYKETKILILSMMGHENYLMKGFEAGAHGFLLKNTGKDELLLAINKLMDGESFICSEIACMIINKIKDKMIFLSKDPSIHLSNRENQILQLIAEGYTNSEIADKIFTSRRTVESHRKKLIEKTNSKNTATLIKYAVENGLINY
jgi:DNA-binding NarL/FixJ family response regulator